MLESALPSAMVRAVASENQRHRNALAPRTLDTIAVVADDSLVGTGDGRNFEAETVALEHRIVAAKPIAC